MAGDPSNEAAALLPHTPATDETNEVDIAIFRTQLPPVSVKYKFPPVSCQIPEGEFTVAADARPLVPVLEATPLPAMVLR